MTTDPSDPVRRLLRLLTLDPVGEDRFLAATPSDGPSRLFGGQVAAQALRAATLTVDAGRPPHSMHAYFVRPGRPGTPLELNVERVRDGRSFTTRQVTASQQGEAIFVLSASFHAGEPGDDWQLPGPVDVPDPDPEPDPTSPMGQFETMSPLDVRPVNRGVGFRGPIHPFWVRTRGPLADDPALHACVIAFLSDMGMVASVRATASTPAERFTGASLDHALWFHRPARADDWLLYDVHPVSNFGSRGLAHGTFHTRDGTLVASVAQEALIRPTSTTPLP